MNFNEFADAVARHFENYLGKEYTVSLNAVAKNNSIRLTGLLMKKETQKITPNIYLNGFYEQYIEEDDFEKVLENIWNTYNEALESFDSQNFDFELDFESQQDYVVYRLINFQENEEKLQSIPYIRFLDLAITFHCFVYMKEDTVSLLPITRSIMSHWNTDVKGLLALAHTNTRRLFPMTCSTLEDVIKRLVDEEEYASLFTTEEDEVKMYVATNSSGINGAAVMLYEEEFQQLAGALGEKLYILPSSIHELIVIPYEKEIEAEKLAELVQEVNQSQVPWEDILSNHVYLYHSQSKSFSIL